jgi:hypothetical protein
MEDNERIEVLEGEVIPESTALVKKEDSRSKLAKLVDSIVLLAGLAVKVVSAFKRDDQEKGDKGLKDSSRKQRTRRRKGQG